MVVPLRWLLSAGLLMAGAFLFGLSGHPASGESAPVTFAEYVNTTGRSLPILEGSSGQVVRIGDRPWTLNPGERFFSLPWGDASRFTWDGRSYHYLGSVAGSRFRFFLIEDWGPVEPVGWIAPTRQSAKPRFELPNQSGKSVPVLDGASGLPIFFGNDPWLIAPGETVLSHPWIDDKRFILDGRPYHFIGTAASTSFFNFFVAPDHNYHESGCTADWTITFYGVSDEKSFGGPKIPVFLADRPDAPLGELPISFLMDTLLQGTGLSRGLLEGRPRHLVVQKLHRDPDGAPVAAEVKFVDGPVGRSGPVVAWATAAGPPDLAYRWRYSSDGPFTQAVIQSFGTANIPKEVSERLIGKPLAITDTGAPPALAPTRHHLDVFVGSLDREDPLIAALIRQGAVKNSSVCVRWP